MNSVDPKESFRYLYDALVELQTRFVNTTMHGMTGIIIVIGWIIHDDKTREYLAKHVAVGHIGALAVIASAGAYTWLSLMGSRALRHLGNQLRELDYLPPTHYAYREYGWVVVILLISLVDVPCVLVVWYLFAPNGLVH